MRQIVTGVVLGVEFAKHDNVLPNDVAVGVLIVSPAPACQPAWRRLWNARWLGAFRHGMLAPALQSVCAMSSRRPALPCCAGHLRLRGW